MAVAVAWDVKVEAHGNKTLYHTSSEQVADWFEDCPYQVVRWGRAYVGEEAHQDMVVAALQQDGFMVR